MKYLKTFESFELNEEILGLPKLIDIKNRVKNIFSMIDLDNDIKQKIKSLGYSNIFTKALEWIKKCGYDVRGVYSWNNSSIDILLEGLTSIDYAIIGVELVDGKIMVGTSPSDRKVCNGPDELKSLVDALKKTNKERKQERKRLEKEQREAVERSRKWRKPEKVTKEAWEDKLRHGKVPFTKKEIDFFQKFKEKNENKKRKIDLGKIGESDTISIKSRDNGYEHYTSITKLDDEWYAIKSVWYQQVVDVTNVENVEGDWEGDYYEEFFVCDEFDEVLGYLERKDSFSFPDGMELLGYLSSKKEEGKKKEEKKEDDEDEEYDEDDDDEDEEYDNIEEYDNEDFEDYKDYGDDEDDEDDEE